VKTGIFQHQDINGDIHDYPWISCISGLWFSMILVTVFFPISIPEIGMMIPSGFHCLIRMGRMGFKEEGWQNDCTQ